MKNKNIEQKFLPEGYRYLKEGESIKQRDYFFGVIKIINEQDKRPREYKQLGQRTSHKKGGIKKNDGR